MEADFLENPTRKRIVLTLKKRGSLSVEDLSREVRITPMGVRQHLMVLVRNGVVEYSAKRNGVGRPGYRYRLTSDAENLFPKAYAEFSVEVLRDIETREGRERIDEIFRRRKDRILNERIKGLPKETGLSGRLQALAEMLRQEGGIVEIEENGDVYYMRQFNCPLASIASVYEEACRYDRLLLEGLIGAEVVQHHGASGGSSACVHIIPKA